MARTNYQYEKRQRDLAKQKKKEEKKARKLDKKNPESAENPDSPPGGDETR